MSQIFVQKQNRIVKLWVRFVDTMQIIAPSFILFTHLITFLICVHQYYLSNLLNFADIIIIISHFLSFANALSISVVWHYHFTIWPYYHYYFAHYLFSFPFCSPFFLLENIMIVSPSPTIEIPSFHITIFTFSPNWFTTI